jgi:nucleotide-binding universal stress UspA family protein
MYQRILIPLEHSAYDAGILEHVRQLARLCGASLVLIHVADGWAARNAQQLALRESEELARDRAYLEETCARLRAEGFSADAVLAAGDPAAEICAAADRERCDLIAMATHGHKGLQDLLYGATANSVRHKTTVPVLMVRGPVPRASESEALA